MVPMLLHSDRWTVTVGPLSVGPLSVGLIYTHPKVMLSMQTVTEINRLHFNCSRMVHGASQGLSPREKIARFLRSNKFKDHAIQSIINALNLQKYSSSKLEKCFLMDKDGVREYLSEQRWNIDAIEVFVDYVWFDKLA